jgi:AcrR family transcriptional regulator
MSTVEPTSDRRVGGCAVRRPWLREHSVEHVALAVTIAKPTVYHCFRSREQIPRSIHEEFIQLLTEQYLQRVSHGLGQ